MSSGENLGDTPCDDRERRTEIDIVFEKTVRHVDAEIKPGAGPRPGDGSGEHARPVAIQLALSGRANADRGE